MTTIQFMMTVFVSGLVLLVGVDLFVRLIDWLYDRMIAADRRPGDDETDPPEWSAPRV